MPKPKLSAHNWIDTFLVAKKKELGSKQFIIWFNDFIQLKDNNIGNLLVGFPMASQENMEKYNEVASSLANLQPKHFLRCHFWKLLVGLEGELDCCKACHTMASKQSPGYEECIRRVSGIEFRVCHKIAQLCLKEKSKVTFSLSIAGKCNKCWFKYTDCICSEMSCDQCGVENCECDEESY